MRCFVAIELDPDFRAALREACAHRIERADDARWTQPENLHITLRFLGDVDPSEVDGIAAAMRTAADAVEPFELTPLEFGGFPSARRPRVLWAGIQDESAGCARWVAHAQPLLEELGFPPDARPFHAHVTLARASSLVGVAQLSRILPGLQFGRTPRLRVQQVVLFQSHLGPTGARYEPLMAVELAGRGLTLPLPA